MTEERIARLNELARKSKAQGLTPEEKTEQAALRREYLDAIRKSLESQLENVYVLDEKGQEQKLKKRPEGPKS